MSADVRHPWVGLQPDGMSRKAEALPTRGVSRKRGGPFTMNAPLERGLELESIAFRLNGAEVSAFPGETLIQVADRLGVAIPRLCYKPGMRADGNCRSCMVEIKGERVLAPSCCRSPVAGMEVQSDSARAVHAQKMIVELLVSDMPDKVYKTDSELEYWRQALGVGKPRFTRREQPAADISHPAMAVNLDACIQCTRCVRACREEQVNDVIGYAYRGGHSSIVFDLHDPDGRFDVRRLRRMRAGLSHRCAGAGERRVSRAGRQDGRRRYARTAAWAAN